MTCTLHILESESANKQLMLKRRVKNLVRRLGRDNVPLTLGSRRMFVGMH